jgi:predicted nucleotidyltransferase
MALGYFGSFSRNEETVHSDIDILVSFKKPIGWAFFDLQDFLEEELKLKVDLVSENALIPWRKMYGLRGLIAHEYFGVDYEMIWEIIKENLPQNKADLLRATALERMAGGSY